MAHLVSYLLHLTLLNLAFGLPAAKTRFTATFDGITARRTLSGLSGRDTIVCPDARENQDESTKDKVRFENAAIEAAARQGLLAQPGSSDANPGGYSIEFENQGDIDFKDCQNEDLYQYPILADGRMYGGGDPGPFRVVFQVDDWKTREGKYCGILYQMFESRSFMHCEDERA
ncbi:hypothetical protein HII31_03240 [Pseudocercospora fuligena]|uniref:AA1-like domain-containing protein n=1 Tax=Pseudocercospora fuligena TaxID=685502 RepID=A0A8H6RQ89_9PEZI|nr:hypothetical protein HII31_03240 [Pseudocercospora fuligena]